VSGPRERKRVVAVEVEGPYPEGKPPFLTLVRHAYRNRYEDGTRSRPYGYEYIHRRGYDAVAMALYHEEDGVPFMAYRPGIRVPVYFRKDLDLCIPDGRERLFTPEAVAGSLESADRGIAGLLHRVVEEVREEAGFHIAPKDVEPLGGGFFPSHGQSSERIFLCAVRVDPGARKDAPGDGSVNETDAPPILFRPLDRILLECVQGRIEDPKVEILALRLCYKLGYDPVREVRREAGEGQAEAFRKALESGGFRAGREG